MITFNGGVQVGWRGGGRGVGTEMGRLGKDQLPHLEFFLWPKCFTEEEDTRPPSSSVRMYVGIYKSQQCAH